VILQCPYCVNNDNLESERRKVIGFGRFYRRSDSRWVRRFKCLKCKRAFSFATFHACYRQNKRQKNEPLRRLLCSGVSLRRSAILLHVSRTTVARKLKFLGLQAKNKFNERAKLFAKSLVVEFDDMETFEHSKCKPLSITLAVEYKSRRILGFEVSRMPAKGPLAVIARKKYGIRPDERPSARKRLFERLNHLIDTAAVVKSDQNPHYSSDVQKYLSGRRHVTYKGRRGCVVGQGELKRGGFDPLFCLNHTCAKLRADINRLFRRTWCTTKVPERLTDHIAIYTNFHNQSLKRV